jgi:predicted SAM-dependent methyltransferase
MERVTELDLALETGEFNAAHWRLIDTAQRLAVELNCTTTVDGFFQDLLF